MDFRQIEAYINVVKYRSFSKAADASFLTQPTVSTHISTLEKELGIQLIDRRGREALPTRSGKILYKYAVNMLNMREKAVFSIQGYSKEIDGVLEIQTSSIPGEYIVPSLMAEFKRKYPLVKFYLEQSDSSKVEENLQEQKGEIGFTGRKELSNNLAYKKLISDKMVLITPKTEKFEALFDGKIRINDFIGEPFIWREQGSATRKEFEDQITGMGYDPKRLNVAARINSMEAIKQAVGSGLGVSIISGIAAERNSEHSKFLTFEIRDIDLDREFYLVWNKNVALSPTAEAFKSFILDSTAVRH